MLRHNNQGNVGLIHTNQSYVVAFTNRLNAKKANSVITSNSVLEITSSFRSLQVALPSNQTYDLVLPKFKKAETNICTINVLDMAEVLCIPFAHNVGVVVAMEIIDDEEKKLVFDSIVIEPYTDMRCFRNAL